MSDAAEKIDSAPAIPLDERGLPEPGVYYDIPDPDYRMVSAASQSELKTIVHHTPAQYRFERMNPRPASDDMDFGRALHSLVLTPDLFESEYVRMPAGAPRRPTERQINAKKPSPETLEAISFWEEWDKENGDKTLISTKTDPDKGVWGMSDWDKLHQMRDRIMEHETANLFLQEGASEVSLVWQSPRVPWLCKARFDRMDWMHNVIFDLKTTQDATWAGFRNSIAKFGYDIQDAHYSEAANVLLGRGWSFVFCVIEKQPPFHVGLYELVPQDKRIGLIKRDKGLRTLKDCVLTGEWPGLPLDVRHIELTEWQRKGAIV